MKLQKEKTGEEFWRRRLDALARDERCLVDLRGRRGQLDPAWHRWRRGGQVFLLELRRQATLAAPAPHADARDNRGDDDRNAEDKEDVEENEEDPTPAAAAAAAAFFFDPRGPPIGDPTP